MNKIKTLKYNDCIIHALPQEAELCCKFLTEFGKTRPHSIVYRGESFASFGAMVFEQLCQVDPRIPPSFLERQATMARSKGLCESCGDEGAEIDHRVPRTCFGKDSIGNYQHLCLSCHRSKSAQDASNRIALEDGNPYLSRFNEATWQAFVNSRRPSQTVCDLHKTTDGPIYHADVRSCRFNALCEANSHDIPIFSPLDEFAGENHRVDSARSAFG